MKHIFVFLTDVSFVRVAYFPPTGLDPNEVLTNPEVVINKHKKTLVASDSCKGQPVEIIALGQLMNLPECQQLFILEKRADKNNKDRRKSSRFGILVDLFVY